MINKKNSWLKLYGRVKTNLLTAMTCHKLIHFIILICKQLLEFFDVIVSYYLLL